MRASLPTTVIVLALAALAHPRVAADYLHGSAGKYIAGRHQEALVEAEEGVRAFPDDPALKTMVAHLRRLKDQQRQDQGSQGSSGGEQGKDENPEDTKDKEQDQSQKEGPEEKDQEAGQGKESPEDKGQDSTGSAETPVKPGEMSKEDAERLLNSIQDDEKKEHRQQQKRWRKRPDVEQDW